jgi:hypothetical protein
LIGMRPGYRGRLWRCPPPVMKSPLGLHHHYRAPEFVIALAPDTNSARALSTSPRVVERSPHNIVKKTQGFAAPRSSSAGGVAWRLCPRVSPNQVDATAAPPRCIFWTIRAKCEVAHTSPRLARVPGGVPVPGGRPWHQNQNQLGSYLPSGWFL